MVDFIVHFLITASGPFLDPWHFDTATTASIDTTVDQALRSALTRLATNSMKDRAKVWLIQDLERQPIQYCFRGRHRVVHPTEILGELEYTEGAIALTFQVVYHLVPRDAVAQENRAAENEHEDAQRGSTQSL